MKKGRLQGRPHALFSLVLFQEERALGVVRMQKLVRLVASGVIGWTPAGKEKYCFIFENTLGNALMKVLQAEGYDVSDNPPLGGVVVLKLKELQRLVIFAADPAIRLGRRTQAAPSPQTAVVPAISQATMPGLEK